MKDWYSFKLCAEALACCNCWLCQTSLDFPEIGPKPGPKPGFARAPNFSHSFRRDRARIEHGRVVVLDDSGCKKPLLSGECCKFVENLNRKEKKKLRRCHSNFRKILHVISFDASNFFHTWPKCSATHPPLVCSINWTPRPGPGEQESLVAIHLNSKGQQLC